MRIGIDCRLAGREHAGIGRYVSQLVKELVKEQTVTWVLTVNSQQQIKELFALKPPNVEVVIANVRHYTLKEQLLMPLIFYQQKLDLLHVPHFNLPILYRKPSVITIHDLLWHQQRGTTVTTLPAWQYWLKYGFYRLTVGAAVWSAQKIITPTKVVKQDVISYYGHAKNKIKTIAEGISLTSLKAKKPVQSLPKDYLLYVGSLYPHKNISLVLNAIQHSLAENLLIVSARSIFTERVLAEIASLGIERRVKILNNIDDQELIWLYRRAKALVQPSFSEGFGLTGLEALACGTQIIVSDIAVFHEVYADQAKYFDPHSLTALLKILKDLKKPSKKEIGQFKKFAAQYDWEKMAKSIFDVYQSCLKRKLQ